MLRWWGRCSYGCCGYKTGRWGQYGDDDNVDDDCIDNSWRQWQWKWWSCSWYRCSVGGAVVLMASVDIKPGDEVNMVVIRVLHNLVYICPWETREGMNYFFCEKLKLWSTLVIMIALLIVIFMGMSKLVMTRWPTSIQRASTISQERRGGISAWSTGCHQYFGLF